MPSEPGGLSRNKPSFRDDGHDFAASLVSEAEVGIAMEIVVVGGGYAGLGAALRASRHARGRGSVRLITEHPSFCERIRLHQLASRLTPIETDLRALLAGTGVALTVGRVERIDLQAKRLALRDRAIGFDRLVVALGSRTDRSIPGAERFAFALDDVGGASALHEALVLCSDAGGEVLVVGGGLTAIEAASEIAEAMPSLRVRLASMAPIADELSRTARRYIARRLSDLRVVVDEGVRVTEIREASAKHTTGSIPFDVCVVATGFSATTLARESGLDVDRRNQIRVDATLRSVSHRFVYGVGDTALPIVDLGGPIVMACRTAGPMASHAADALGLELRDREPEPMRFADTGRCVSLGRNDGLLTIHRPDGTPTEHVIGGRAGAFIKEGICRFTVARIESEAFRARLGARGVGQSTRELAETTH